MVMYKIDMKFNLPILMFSRFIFLFEKLFKYLIYNIKCLSSLLEWIAVNLFYYSEICSCQKLLNIIEGF